MIKTKGRNCHIFKRDLRRAYRQIPIDPGDINLVGFHWINHRFVDRVLSMGLRSSAHRREYFHVVLPSHVLNQNININQLELLVVMVCVKLWNTHLFKKKILIKCDNQSVVIVLNSGSTRDLFMQTCLREIIFFAAKFHFEVRAIHFPGVENRVADLLSRWHMNCSYKEEFFNLPNISASSCNEKFVYS